MVRGPRIAAAFRPVSPCLLCGRRRAPFEVADQAGKHGKPGAFEVVAATGERPGLVDIEPDDGVELLASKWRHQDLPDRSCGGRPEERAADVGDPDPAGAIGD